MTSRDAGSGGSGPRRPRGRLRRWLVRGLAVVAVLLVVTLGAAWLWLESDAAAERLRVLLEARLAGALQLPVRVASLDIDLVPFHVTVSGVEVAGGPGDDGPVLTLAAAEVSVLPWALTRRRLEVARLVLTEPRLHLDLYADGTTNLPAIPSTPGGGLALHVAELEVRGGRLEINHLPTELDARLAALDLDMGDAGADGHRRGTVRFGEGEILVDHESGPVRLEPLTVDLDFTLTPEELLVDALGVDLSGSHVESSGTIHRWSDADLEIGATIQAADIAALLAPDGPVHEGEIRLDGRLLWEEGEGVRLVGDVGAPRVTVAGLPLEELTARLEVDAARVAVRDVTLGLYGGTVTGSVERDRTTTPATWAVTYRAEELDLARLTTWEALQGLRYAGRATAEGELGWRGPWRESLTGSGTLDLAVPPESLASAAAAALPAAAGTAGALAAAPRDAPGAAIPVPSLPLPVTATAAYRVDAGSFQVEEARARLPRTEVTASGRYDLDGVVDATLAIDSRDLRFLDRFFTQVRRYRGERPTPMPLGLEGSGVLDVRLSGPVGGPDVVGRVLADGLVVRDNPVGAVEGDLRLDVGALSVDNLVVRRGDGEARGSAVFRIGTSGVDPAGPDYSVEARLVDYPLELDLSRSDVPFAIAGPADGRVDLSGRYGEAPLGTVEASAGTLALNGVGPFRGDLRVRLTETVWYANRVELEGPVGHIEVSGSLTLPEETVSARLEATGIDAGLLGDLLGLSLPLGGQVDATADLRGPATSPDATANLVWTDATWRGASLGAVAVSASIVDRILAAAFVGNAGTAVPPDPVEPPQVSPLAEPPALPTVPPRGWAATVGLQLGPSPVARVLAEGDAAWVPGVLETQGLDVPAELTVSGQVTAQGSLPLDDWQSWDGSATLTNLVIGLGEIGLTATRPLEIGLETGLLTVELPELVSPDGLFQAHATVDLVERRWLEARAEGHLELGVLRIFFPEIEASGHLDGEVVAAGSLDDTRLQGAVRLDEIGLSAPGWPYPAESVSGSVRLGGDLMELVDVRGTSAGREFTIDGELPLAALTGGDTSAPVALELAVNDLPLRPLVEGSPRLGDLVAGGLVSLTARVEGFGVAWRGYTGQVEVRRLQLPLADAAVALVEPVTLPLRSGVLELEPALHLQGAGTDVRVGGLLELAPLELDLLLAGRLNLDPLNALVENWGFGGRADVDLNVGGRSPDLAYEGRVEIVDGLVSPPPIGQPVESIEAVLVFTGREVTIESFDGRLGGGAVTAGGSLQLRDSTPSSFDLDLSVEEALVRIERDVRLTVTADLDHEGTRERSLLSGTIFVDQGEYERRWEPGEPVLDLASVPGGAPEDPFLGSVNLDLRIDAPQDLRVVNNMADLELQADLEVRGTLQEPVLLGRAVVLEGDVAWRDNTYRILQGTVELQNPVRTEPTFDIRAETIIRQYTVTLNLSGSLDSGMQFSYASSPPLSDLELLRLLALGQAPEGTGEEGVNLGNVGLQASNFLTAQYLNEVSRGAQRVFGVDRFRIEPTIYGNSADPTARVTVGEQIARNLAVTYSTVLGQGDEQLITVEYQLTRGIRVIGTREEDGSFGLDFRVDHRF